MELLDKFNAVRQEIFDYFGYKEDWLVLPLEDARGYFWSVDGYGPTTVKFADTEDELKTESGNYYEDEIYTQRHLPRVYRGEHFTMVAVDTHTDGNKFLRIFDNEKER